MGSKHTLTPHTYFQAVRTPSPPWSTTCLWQNYCIRYIRIIWGSYSLSIFLYDRQEMTLIWCRLKLKTVSKQLLRFIKRQSLRKNKAHVNAVQRRVTLSITGQGHSHLSPCRLGSSLYVVTQVICTNYPPVQAAEMTLICCRIKLITESKQLLRLKKRQSIRKNPGACKCCSVKINPVYGRSGSFISQPCRLGSSFYIVSQWYVQTSRQSKQQISRRSPITRPFRQQKSRKFPTVIKNNHVTISSCCCSFSTVIFRFLYERQEMTLICCRIKLKTVSKQLLRFIKLQSLRQNKGACKRCSVKSNPIYKRSRSFTYQPLPPG